jgi:5-methylcytosine-specific restriction endonuclease McrA
MRQTLDRRRCVVFHKDTPDFRGDQNDPFGEDFFLVPSEEIRARAEYILGENRDYLRHYVELAIWYAQDNPDLRKVLLSLLWLWEAVDPQWLAEASPMAVSDVRNLTESQPVMMFNCLDCGTELADKSRLQEIGMQHSLEVYCGDKTKNAPPVNLLCGSCHQQRKDHDEQQADLDRRRYQALLEEHRERPYEDRRQTQEWKVLKKQIHRRDGYRCRLCGRNGVQLHVHHRTYATYAEERLEDLITLCCSCHETFHFLSEAS